MYSYFMIKKPSVVPSSPFQNVKTTEDPAEIPRFDSISNSYLVVLFTGIGNFRCGNEALGHVANQSRGPICRAHTKRFHQLNFLCCAPSFPSASPKTERARFSQPAQIALCPQIRKSARAQNVFFPLLRAEGCRNVQF